MPSEDRVAPAVVHDALPRPNLTGDLDAILVTIPAFRPRLHGYDRMQVDNYVRWSETELLSARREVDDLATRYGLCLAEVRTLRQVTAQSPESRQLHQVSQRIDQMLQTAAEAADELRAAATEETERAHEERARAEAIVVRARAEAARLVQEATAEREALVAAMTSELADLARQRDQARECLATLGAQIAQALDALAEGLPSEIRLQQSAPHGPREHVLAGNRVAAS